VRTSETVAARDDLGGAEGTLLSAGSQILCCWPRMKQPPGGRAERLLMSMSWTAIDRII